ncbi:uncharacterized protein PHACADRAFT_142709 [Phanerochaete carnosa HHB-10118-sp]|uniref:Uncharacterized protein n=1 Tax=Phanerochaete carnosa (strain HHB-10118-sp) TaxID=650164 RepID=K5W7J0_PHACS|nr:uncharacterized protein PHACADRAFT_142709 [Phanerochaete carnosa HHB-10118-sp]EKM54929.1 hypothetical protein PHACADRAFT_142709 [Phanerochaete carnosa HHB-10118-sp]
MKAGVYDLLGVASPFDPSFSLVTSPLLPPLALALLRLSLALYCTFFMLFRLINEGIKNHSDAMFFSFFTNLSYLGLLSYFWASGVQTFSFSLALRSPSHTPHYLLQAWPRPLQVLHLLLQSTVTTFPILVTAVFWSLLSGTSTFATRYNAWVNISEHALNTAFATLDIFLTNASPSLPGRPHSGVALPWAHLPFLIVLLACYLGVAYVTSATQHFYPYSFLNPHTQHAKLAAYIVGIAAAEVIIFVIVRYIMMLRHLLVLRFNRNAQEEVEYFAGSVIIGKSNKEGVEALEDWERVSLTDGERGIAL